MKPARSANSTLTSRLPAAVSSRYEVAEALGRALAPDGHGDRPEGHEHQQVPLPPGGVPVAGEGHGHHRLGQQREGHRHAEQDDRPAAAVHHEVATGRVRVERQRDQPASPTSRPLARSVGVGIVERRQRGQGHQRPRRPAAPARPARSSPGATHQRVGRASRRSGAADAAARTPASSRPTGVAMTKPCVGPVEQHLRRGQGVQAQEARRDRGTPATPGSSRASARRRAVSAVANARTAAAPRRWSSTSQKWAGWSSHRTSASGAASRSGQAGQGQEQDQDRHHHAAAPGRPYALSARCDRARPARAPSRRTRKVPSVS